MKISKNIFSAILILFMLPVLSSADNLIGVPVVPDPTPPTPPSNNGTSCSATKQYPYFIYGESTTINYTPKLPVNLLNGLLGWFGAGNIGSITSSRHYGGYMVCCSGEEKIWAYNFCHINVGTTSVSASVGASAAGVLENVISMISGYGFSIEQLATLSSTVSLLGITGVSASFSHSGNYYAPDEIIDECKCPNAERAPFMGNQYFTLTAGGPETEQVLVEFHLLQGSSNWHLKGLAYGVNDDPVMWYITCEQEAEVTSSWRIGENAQEHIETHIAIDSETPVMSGIWCNTSLLGDY